MLLTAGRCSPRPGADAARTSCTTCAATSAGAPGYRKIVDAILAGRADDGPVSRAARSASSADPSAASTRWRRSRAGRAMSPTSMHARHGCTRRLLRSPYAHARVPRVDASARRARARRPRRAHAAPTSRGATRTSGPRSATARSSPSTWPATRASRSRRWSPIDEATADEALELIEVDYEPLAAGDDARGGAGAGRAARPHRAAAGRSLRRSLDAQARSPGTNVCHQFHFERGDAARGASPTADLVLDETLPLSARAALRDGAPRGAWPPGTRRAALTVWASTQNPYSVRVELAKMFGVPLARIRVVVPLLGGGFGEQDLREARAARGGARARGAAGRCGSPPPWPRTPSGPSAAAARACTSRVGFRRDGAARRRRVRRGLRRRRLRRHRPARRPEGAPTRRPAPIASPHVTLDARAVYTNTTPGGAFRGFGVPQLAWALESLIRRGRRAARSRSRGSAPAEPSRPRRGVRAGRHADRRQARGESRPRRRGDRLDAGAARPTAGAASP